MENKILEKLREILPGVQGNVLLKDYTTYKIGGPAKYFFIAKNKDGLIRAVEISKRFKLPVFILGGGSNLLVSDKGFKGFVIKIDIKDIDFLGNKAVVGAGASLPKLAALAASKGFSGLEWSAGVPGTVGGAIYGHAQAFGTKISSSVIRVEALDIQSLKVKNFSKKQCQFSLKNSIFKKNKNLVIIGTTLEFIPGNPEDIKNKIDEFIKYRKEKHPKLPSAGSTFVNPEIKIKNKKLLEKFPELIEFNKRGIIPAGYLIQKSGIQGKKIGNAQISEKHANFIVNLGGADAKSVAGLVKLAKIKVKKNFGIDLEAEVQFVGF